MTNNFNDDLTEIIPEYDEPPTVVLDPVPSPQGKTTPAFKEFATREDVLLVQTPTYRVDSSYEAFLKDKPRVEGRAILDVLEPTEVKKKRGAGVYVATGLAAAILVTGGAIAGPRLLGHNTEAPVAGPTTTAATTVTAAATVEQAKTTTNDTSSPTATATPSPTATASPSQEPEHTSLEKIAQEKEPGTVSAKSLGYAITTREGAVFIDRGPKAAPYVYFPDTGTVTNPNERMGLNGVSVDLGYVNTDFKYNLSDEYILEMVAHLEENTVTNVMNKSVLTKIDHDNVTQYSHGFYAIPSDTFPGLFILTDGEQILGLIANSSFKDFDLSALHTPDILVSNYAGHEAIYFSPYGIERMPQGPQNIQGTWLKV